MTDGKLTRRQAILASAAVGGAAAALTSREVHAAGPARKWESSYSGGSNPAPRAPGQPGRDYKPTVTPGGATLPWKIIDGVKVYHLVAQEVDHEFAPGLRALCWGYNGRVHGPTIEAVEGDRVRIYVTNKLPSPTSVHWHGIFLPNGMDGVSGLNQKPIPPGKTFRYEWTFKQSGTFMYHSHHDEMVQMALGMLGMIVVHPRPAPAGYRVDRDFVILLSEWKIVPGAKRPDPLEMTDFNVLTMNAKAFPGTAPLVCRTGERVRIRFGNLSAMDHHPIHIHGYYWKIVATDGGPIPPSAQWPETTVLVPVGSTRDVEFIADAPGDWAMHCHMTHHVMNQMGHDIPNMIGVDTKKVAALGGRVVPGYMPMGERGMEEMAQMSMPVPKNSIPMVGAKGPFEHIGMGGMFTIVKVRDEDVGAENKDPGWYKHPPDTVADLARKEDMDRDGIQV